MSSDINDLSLTQRWLYVILFVLFFSIVSTIILEAELEDYTFNNNETLISQNLE